MSLGGHGKAMFVFNEVPLEDGPALLLGGNWGPERPRPGEEVNVGKAAEDDGPAVLAG